MSKNTQKIAFIKGDSVDSMVLHFTDKSIFIDDVLNKLRTINGVIGFYNHVDSFFLTFYKGKLFSFEGDIIPQIMKIYYDALAKQILQYPQLHQKWK